MSPDPRKSSPFILFLLLPVLPELPRAGRSQNAFWLVQEIWCNPLFGSLILSALWAHTQVYVLPWLQAPPRCLCSKPELLCCFAGWVAQNLLEVEEALLSFCSSYRLLAYLSPMLICWTGWVQNLLEVEGVLLSFCNRYRLASPFCLLCWSAWWVAEYCGSQ